MKTWQLSQENRAEWFSLALDCFFTHFLLILCDRYTSSFGIACLRQNNKPNVCNSLPITFNVFIGSQNY